MSGPVQRSAGRPVFVLDPLRARSLPWTPARTRRFGQRRDAV